MERVGDFDSGDFIGGDPVVALADDRAAVDEHADDLLDEEGIAFGPGKYQLARLIGQRFDRQEVADQGAAVVDGQGVESYLGEDVAVDLACARDEPPTDCSALLTRT